MTVEQALNLTSAATASATGTATFNFNAPAVSQDWTGTLNCPTAPDTANFTILVSNASIGAFRASNSYGPIHLGMNDFLSLTATGLVPGVSYAVSFLGVAITEGSPSPAWPAAYADAVTTAQENIYLSTGGPVTTLTQVVTLQNVWRSLWVAVKWTNLATTSITVTGNQSGIVYQSFKPPYFVNASNAFYRYAVVSGLDTSVTISITSSANFTAYWGADLAAIDIATYSTIAAVLGVNFNPASSSLTYSTYTTSTQNGYQITAGIPATASQLTFSAQALGAAASTFSAVASPTAAAPVGIVCMGGTWVWIQASTAGFYSINDGASWTSMTLPATCAFIASTGTAFVAIPAAAGRTVYTSTDGHTWVTNATALPGVVTIGGSLGSGNGVVMATTTVGVSYVSNAAGTAWTAGATIVHSSAAHSIAYIPSVNTWVAFPTFGGAATYSYSTNNGQSWSTGTWGTTFTTISSAVNGSYLIAVDSGTANVYYSIDGTSWTLATGTLTGSQMVTTVNGTVVIPTTAAATFTYTSVNCTSYSAGNNTTVAVAPITTNQGWAANPTTGVCLILNTTTPFALQKWTQSSVATTTVTLVGLLSGTTYATFTAAPGVVASWTGYIAPAVDTQYLLVNALPLVGNGWVLTSTTNAATAPANYVSTTAPPLNTNVIVITYQIFTSQPGQIATIADALGNVIGTVPLSTAPGVYTARIANSNNTSTNISVSGTSPNIGWKLYSMGVAN